jgi:hypothetical protein
LQKVTEKGVDSYQLVVGNEATIQETEKTTNRIPT